jgi:ribonuclease BN (tRNA processing enzyme)
LGSHAAKAAADGIDAIAITHLHPDHMLDLIALPRDPRSASPETSAGR